MKTAIKRNATRRFGCRRIIAAVCVTVALSCLAALAQDSWQPALQRMTLGPAVSRLDRTNCVAVILKAFQPDPVVKALIFMIFMPGATDELYMFHRVNAVITNNSPTLLDAVTALTNQTFIHVAFRAPFLLFHTDEDSLDLLVTVEDQKALAALKKGGKLPQLMADDRDWDFIQPLLRKTVNADIQPWRYSTSSWHFYRHSLCAWNLTGWEALQAVAYAGKTRFAVRRKGIFSIPRTEVVFEPDSRTGTVPKLEGFPR
jgi:hypothetical protein